MNPHPPGRFLNRVDNGPLPPRYPPAVLDTLRARCGLTPSTVFADVGAGHGKIAMIYDTRIFTAQF